MDRLTLIVMPEDATGQVRRFQLPRLWIRRGAIAAAVGLVLGVGIAVDWVGLRLDAVEVAALRAEAERYRSDLEGVVGTVDSLEAHMTRLRELERKVRVIADLPGAPVETDEQAVLPAGQGGTEAEPLDGLGAPPGAAAGGGAPAWEETPPSAAATYLELDPAALARVQAKAQRLSVFAEAQSSAFEDLVEGLRGKAKRLASTPSIWPAQGWLTSRFGHRVSPFTGLRKFHSGIDIAAAPGTPVIAPARGRVLFVGRKGPLGNALVIDHGFGVRTSYGHNQEIFVRRGEDVERGQRIASIGNSGRSTGPHLHYGIEVDGRARDPLDYILE